MTLIGQIWEPVSDDAIPDSWLQGSMIGMEPYDGRVYSIPGGKPRKVNEDE